MAYMILFIILSNKYIKGLGQFRDRGSVLSATKINSLIQFNNTLTVEGRTVKYREDTRSRCFWECANWPCFVFRLDIQTDALTPDGG